MAAQLTQAGTITREQTLLPTRRLPVAATEVIVRGNVLEADAGGDLIVSVGAAAPTQNATHFVALESVTGGVADGDVDVAVAVRGHFVTVVSSGVIRSGSYVSIHQAVSAPDDGKVQDIAALTITSAVGIYWGKEGGVVAKGASGDFLETYTDTENFLQVDAAADDIVEIELI